MSTEVPKGRVHRLHKATPAATAAKVHDLPGGDFIEDAAEGLTLCRIDPDSEVGGEVLIRKRVRLTALRWSEWLDGGRTGAELAELADSVDPEGRRLRVVGLGEFLALELPPREYLLEPILPRQGLVMLYAKRGVGKTWLALWIAYAVAAGIKCLRWSAPAPRRVLYLDGEMPAAVLQERLSVIVQAEGYEPDPDALRIVTPDLQPNGMPDLSTREGQAAIEPLLEGIDLVVIDNLSSLCRTGIENEGESWIDIQGWALRQRAAGRSVLFIHHAGKGGQQRGTSRREDVLDTVLALRQPANYRPTDGARFEVHFEKHRTFYGEDAQPFEAVLCTSDGGVFAWGLSSLEGKLVEQVADLHRDGESVREIAAALGKSKSSVDRYLKQARARGLLND